MRRHVVNWLVMDDLWKWCWMVDWFVMNFRKMSIVMNRLLNWFRVDWSAVNWSVTDVLMIDWLVMDMNLFVVRNNWLWVRNFVMNNGFWMNGFVVKWLWVRKNVIRMWAFILHSRLRKSLQMMQ